ncbi:MAG: helix-turn-helix transcriptional regulator [Oscillospiraceae bacterium]|nr:helix-turn-helix transcriptional regulator [Oscillospiraceae bacterium]MBR2366917.1 helix-turn-helix transcriptional regulator [Oscillospiraceae bacterium]MBR2896704.1 helix-turn-helix transcriptional regulator [Oscillospiraceae bacterium]
MDGLKVIVASNLIRLRNAAGLTQAELAEQLNYSDKSVSKWERAESVPDVATLKEICTLFGVTLDYITTEHTDWTPPKGRFSGVDTRAITSVTMVGMALLALLIFIIFWILGKIVWITFIYAVTAELILYLILHSVWGGGTQNYFIIAALAASAIASVYFSFFVFGNLNLWQLFLLLVPGELIVYLSSRIRKKAPEGKK